jgi:putrescine importer
MINALLTNIYLSSLFPGVPKAVWIISFVVIMTIMNIFSVHLTVSFGTLLVAFQILVAIIFIILSATTQGQELSFKPFISESASISLLLNGAAILCFSFLGFDAVTTMAEETLKPEKTIPKGILIIACTGGALFITVSYFAQLLFPSASLFHDLEGASAEIAYKIGGQLFQSIFVAAALTSTIASGLVSHMSASRLLYAIGKDGYLPRRIFGYIHPKTKTPVWNVVIIGGLSLISLGLSLEKATSLINFGALIAFSSVNIAVFIHYFIHQNKRSLSGYISYVLMPLLGSLFLFFMWLNLEKTSLFIGIVWSVIGIIYLLIARRKNTITIPTFHFD